MMSVAVLMRAWVKVAKELDVEPKVLADDVIVIAKGTRMLKRLARALTATHHYLQEGFGSRIV